MYLHRARLLQLREYIVKVENVLRLWLKDHNRAFSHEPSTMNQNINRHNYEEFSCCM